MVGEKSDSDTIAQHVKKIDCANTLKINLEWGGGGFFNCGCVGTYRLVQLGFSKPQLPSRFMGFPMVLEQI